MRVLAVDIWGHPGVGDLSVTFADSAGHASRTVVLAGENGCGKTAILEAIFAAVAPSFSLSSSPTPLSMGRYRVMLELDRPVRDGAFQAAISPELFHEMRARWPSFKGIVAEFEVTQSNNGAIERRYTRMSDNLATHANFDPELVFDRQISCFYSEANLSFNVNVIQSIGLAAWQSESPKNHELPQIVRGGDALGTQIPQMLVDLEAADNRDVAEWIKANSGRPPDDIISPRMRRFTDAFAKMMPDKRYIGVETADNQHRVMFEDHGLRMHVGQLSTGEKQIIFRGAFLLRQFTHLPGSIILLDEPELSLHPNWQENILNYYESIANITSESAGQLIVATHSPFVVHGSPTACHVILRRDRTHGTVKSDVVPTYPGVTSTEVAVRAFDLVEFLNDAKEKRLSLLVEGVTDMKVITNAWLKLNPGVPMPFSLQFAEGAPNIFRLLSPGGGKSGPLLDELKASGTAVVGLFDFDQSGHGQWNGTVKISDTDALFTTASSIQTARKRAGVPIWVTLLPIPAFRQGYASLQLGSDSRLTIELLFPDTYVEHLLTRVTVAGDGDGTRLEASDAQKHLVADASEDFPREAFAEFEPLFLLLREIAQFPR